MLRRGGKPLLSQSSHCSSILKNIQALRAIAATLVVLDHVNLLILRADPAAKTIFTPFGYFGAFGVDLFFVISGFIMVTTSWNAFEKRGASLEFILRRFARIYPPYWLVLLPIASAYILAPHLLMRAHEGRSDVFSSLLLLPQSTPPLLLVSWTLTFEIFFYLAFAAILNVQRRFLVAALVFWFVLEVAATALWHGAPNPWLEMLGNPLPIEFIAGALIGSAYRKNTVRFPFCVGVCGLVIAASIFLANARLGLSFDLWRADFTRVITFGIPATLIVYGAIGFEMRKEPRVPKWLVALGNASYSTYLCHVPLIVGFAALAMRFRVHGVVLDTIVECAAVLLVLGVSLVTYRYAELPLTKVANQLVVRLRRNRIHSSNTFSAKSIVSPETVVDA